MNAKKSGNGRGKGRKETAAAPSPVPSIEWVGFESEAKYADVIRISSKERHFLLTFGQTRPDSENFTVVSQVFLAPQTAGELTVLLARQATRYEKDHGKKILPESVTLEVKKRK